MKVGMFTIFLFGLFFSGTAMGSLTGSWHGEGKSAFVDLDLIGCNDTRCLFRLGLGGIGEKSRYAERSGILILKPGPKTEFDEPKLLSFDANILVSGNRVSFHLLQCTKSCNDKRKVFADVPETIALTQVSTSASFHPSFDCLKATRLFEEVICRYESLSNQDRDLNFEYEEYLSYLANPEARSSLKKDQVDWYKSWSKQCASAQYHDVWKVCSRELEKRTKQLRALKDGSTDCSKPISGFQAVLCDTQGLGKKLLDWNDIIAKLEAEDEKKEPGPYSKTAFRYGWPKFNRQTCYGILNQADLQQCLNKKLDEYSSILQRSKISEADWKWMLAFDGANTNHFVWDHSATQFFSKRLPKKTFSQVLSRLSGPPEEIRVTANRFVWITGCMAHSCSDVGYIWIDSEEKKVIFGYGNIPYKTPCVEAAINESLPQAFLSAYKPWASGKCNLQGPFGQDSF